MKSNVHTRFGFIINISAYFNLLAIIKYRLTDITISISESNKPSEPTATTKLGLPNATNTHRQVVAGKVAGTLTPEKERPPQ